MNTLTNFTFSITSFPKAYFIVFSLVVLLYFVAGSTVSLFYSVCKKLNIGELIEKRPLKEHQIRSEISWGIVTCSIFAIYLYASFIFALILPISLSVLLGIFIYLIFGIANGHSSYNLIPKYRSIPMLQELTCFHQRHLSSERANFGYLFTHWDVVFGTRHKINENS